MYHKKPVFSKLLYTLLTLVFVLLACTGCNADAEIPHAATSESQPTDTAGEAGTLSDRHLRISLTPDPETQIHTFFTSEELGGNFTEDLQYGQVKDVTIEIDGKAINLDEALRDGVITEEEIFCYARLDAADGICQESYKSRHGLNHFTYSYPEFDLRIIYDVYETPDGQQHLISDMGLYLPGNAPDAYTSFVDSEQGAILRYDQEDWGLSFEVMEASSTGITIKCTQSGGQQIGQLYTNNYDLQNSVENYRVERVDGEETNATFKQAINMDGTTELVIDWGPCYGNLPSGDYSIVLTIEDVFDRSEVHPLMNDYHDIWVYSVEFAIP